MTLQRRGLRLAAAAVATALLAGCATTQVSSFLERGIDISRYRAYAWGPPDMLATGDPRLDSNPFFQTRVQAEVDRRLAAQGFEKTDAAAADLLVHYHVSVTQRIDVNSVDQQYGYCNDCRPDLYDAGTLTLDLVDARTNRLAWRGWAARSFDGVLDRQEWMEQQIDRAVARILDQLPRAFALARGAQSPALP